MNFAPPSILTTKNTKSQFEEFSSKAKEGSTVSKVLNAKISLEVTLVG